MDTLSAVCGGVFCYAEAADTEVKDLSQNAKAVAECDRSPPTRITTGFSTDLLPLHRLICCILRQI